MSVISTVRRKYGINEEFLVFGMGSIFYDERRPNDQSICQRLISLRGERSTYAFAKMCGIGLPTYEAIERGEKEVTLKQIRRIAEATSVGEKWLLTGDEKTRDYPVNDELIAYLEAHPEIRKQIWEQIGEPEDIGKKLKEKRLALGLTQKQVAEILGVQRVAVIEIEVGGRRKDYGLMEKVRKWVNTSAELDH